MGALTLPERIGLDTNCFVYLFEAPDSARGAFLRDQVFGPLARGGRSAVTSTLTLTELLVKAYADGEPHQAAELRAAFTALPGLEVVPLDVRVADVAGRLRGERGLRLADAVQLATTEVGGAAALVTNDRRVRASEHGPAVLIVDDLIG